jgi:hypothetical protein
MSKRSLRSGLGTWPHRIRFALHSGSFEKFSGHVEVDETYIGGKAQNMHKTRKARTLQGKGGGKTAGTMTVQGGKVRASVIENTQ